MPLRHKSAQKRARQTKKITDRNKNIKALIKGTVKKVSSIKDKATAETEFKKTTRILDRAAAKGVIHKKKAANVKSKLAKHINKVK
jgi:small subunit ribosomal protein S20